MNKDVVALRDLYGGQGYVFANVEAEPRFLEEPGLLDIVYKIEEGKQYRVGNINVHYRRWRRNYQAGSRFARDSVRLRPGD